MTSGTGGLPWSQRPVEDVGAEAGRLVREAFGSSSRLTNPRSLKDVAGHAKAIRFDVEGGGSAVPASVVVKRPAAWGDYEAETGGGTAWGVRIEWAALEFLGPSGVAASLLAADAATGILVTEDLGDAGGDRVLLGDDPRAAARYLVEWADALGRMHAFTIGRRDEHAAVLERVAPGYQGLDRHDWIPEDLAQIIATECAAVGLLATDAALDELRDAQAVLAAPGPLDAFTHGDPCPDNDRTLHGRVRLFDFEIGGFRHALTDGTYATVPYPTCWCANRIPDEVVDEVTSAYREALASACAAARDDDTFVRALTDVWAWQVARTTAWGLPSAMFSGGRWGISTNSQRLALRLNRFARRAPDGLYPAFRALAERLAARAGVSEDDMPLYPAFR